MRRLMAWGLVLVFAVLLRGGMPAAAASAEKKLYDAALRSDGKIGVLYMVGSAVCYGVLDPVSGEWSGGAVAGVTGKDAAMALGPGGEPHIAYITSGDDLGYVKWNGSGWSEPVVMSSIAQQGVDGALSAPDIAVDGEGYAHIAYMDAKGGWDASNPFSGYDGPDLAYATNKSGSFERAVRSYGHGRIASPVIWKSEIKPPPKIVWAGDYRIGVWRYELDMDGADTTYTNSFDLFSSIGAVSYKFSTMKDNNDSRGFALHDMETDGDAVYSLFTMKDSSSKLNLYVARETTVLIGASAAFTAGGADLFVSGGGVYYAGIKDSSLLLYQNGLFKENLALSTAVGSHARIATAVGGGVQYTLYNDASYNLWVAAVPVEAGSTGVVSYKVVDKTPVTVSGIEVKGKVYDGAAAVMEGTPVFMSGQTVVSVSGYDCVWYEGDTRLPGVPSKAGSYTLEVSVKGSDELYSGGTKLPFVIEQRAVAVAGLQAVGRDYDATAVVKLSGGKLSGAVEGDRVWAVIPETGIAADPRAGKNRPVMIGTVTLEGEDAGNYRLVQPSGVTVDIGRAALGIDGVTLGSRAYNGGAAASVTGVSFSGLLGGDTLELGTDYQVSASYETAGAGEGIPVAGSVTLLETGKAGNYHLVLGTFSATGDIAKAGGMTAVTPEAILLRRGRDGSYALSGIGLNRSDAGERSHALGALTGDGIFSAAPSLEEDGHTLVYTAGAAGSGTAELVVRVVSQNYEDAEVRLTFRMTERMTVEIAGVSVAGKTYDGEAAAVAEAPVFTVGGEPVEVSGYEYAWYEGMVRLGGAPSGAGSYRLVISVSEEDPDYAGSGEIFFEIGKRTLVVRPGDRVITAGEALPETGLVYEGLVLGESGEAVVDFGGPPVIGLRDSEGGVPESSHVPGEYAYVVANAADAVSRNYSVTVELGLLRVLPAAVNEETGNGPEPPVILAVGEAVRLEKNAVPGETGYGVSVTEAEAGALLAASGGRTVEIAVLTPEGAGSVSVKLPWALLGGLSGKSGAGLRVVTPLLTVTLDSGAMSAAVGGEVEVLMSRLAPEVLPEELAALAAGRPVYEVSLYCGGRAVSELGDGRAVLSVPYTLGPGEEAESVVMLGRNGEGGFTVLRGRYDEALGRAVFETGHFSEFLVAYRAVEFDDVAEGAWYGRAVRFIAARGITDGVEPGRFGPEGEITRGQFIVMLLRAFGVAPDSPGGGNFADAGDDYYTGYLAAAKRLGISGGVGDNRFEPGKAVTRQELFTLLYRTLTVLGELPAGEAGEAPDFPDGDSVLDYAREAVEALASRGIVTGVDGKLAPDASCTRAQMAQLLYRLLGQ